MEEGSKGRSLVGVGHMPRILLNPFHGGRQTSAEMAIATGGRFEILE
jgi:hypothetical protein